MLKQALHDIVIVMNTISNISVLLVFVLRKIGRVLAQNSVCLANDPGVGGCAGGVTVALRCEMQPLLNPEPSSLDLARPMS